MLKYGFRCKNCGFTKLSDDKAEVQEARNSHKRKTIKGADGITRTLKCILLPTGRGTVARPYIVDLIQEGLI